MNEVETYIKKGAALPPGEFVVEAPVLLGPNDRLHGSGKRTVIAASGDFPIVVSRTPFAQIENVWLKGGRHGVHLQGGRYIQARNVYISHASSHGVLVEGGSWCNLWSQCTFIHNKGDGYHSVSTGTGGDQQNGNNTSFDSCHFWRNDGNGLVWSAAGLNCSGCLFEANGGDGLLLDGVARSCYGISVSGCYFEAGATGLHARGKTGNAVYSVDVRGCYLCNAEPMVLVDGDYNTVRCLTLDKTNYMWARADTWVDLGPAAKQCTIQVIGPRDRYKISDGNSVAPLVTQPPDALDAEPSAVEKQK